MALYKTETPTSTIVSGKLGHCANRKEECHVEIKKLCVNAFTSELTLAIKNCFIMHTAIFYTAIQMHYLQRQNEHKRVSKILLKNYTCKFLTQHNLKFLHDV
jgi:hypothetical protein